MNRISELSKRVATLCGGILGYENNAQQPSADAKISTFLARESFRLNNPLRILFQQLRSIASIDGVDQFFNNQSAKVKSEILKRLTAVEISLKGYDGVRRGLHVPSPNTWKEDLKLLVDDATDKVVKCNMVLADSLNQMLAEINVQKALKEATKKLDEDRRIEAEAELRNLNNAFEHLKQSIDTRFEALASLELKQGFTQEIDEQIRSHNIKTRIWGGILALALIVAARLLIWMSVDCDKLFFWSGPVFRTPPPAAELAVVVGYAISKILMATFAFGICMIAARMYQTHVHNSVANSHRKIAMACFSKLYQSLPQSESVSNSRHNLVVQAGEAIFSPGSTGFLPKGSSEFAGAGALATEVLKASKSGD